MIEDVLKLPEKRQSLPRLWPLFWMTGASASGKTSLKMGLEEEINRLGQLWNSEIKIQRFQWHTTREKRSYEENMDENLRDHNHIQGKSREEREAIFQGLKLDHIIRHPDSEQGNLYGFDRSIEEILMQRPLIFSSAPEWAERDLEFLKNLMPELYIVTIGIISENAGENLNRRGTHSNNRDHHNLVSYHEIEMSHIHNLSERFNYIINNTGVDADEQLLAEYPHKVFQNIQKQLLKLRAITLWELFKWSNGFNNPYFCTEQERKENFRNYIKANIERLTGRNPEEVQEGSLNPSRFLTNYFLIKNATVSSSTLQLTLETPIQSLEKEQEMEIILRQLKGLPRDDTRIKIPLDLISCQFGDNYEEEGLERRVRLSDRKSGPFMTIKATHKPNSSDAYGERIRPVIEKFFMRYLEGKNPTNDEREISKDDLEEIINEIILPSPRVLVDRKIYPWMVEEKGRRVSDGMFPFLVLGDKGEKRYQVFNQPLFVTSGITLNFLNECYQLTGDERYLEQLIYGMRLINSHREELLSSRFNLSIIAGEVSEIARYEDIKEASDFVDWSSDKISELYDEENSFFHHNTKSNYFVVYNSSLPLLILRAVSKNNLGMRLLGHYQIIKNSDLLREDYSVGEKINLMDRKLENIAGYDPSNNGNTHFSRAQVSFLDQLIQIQDIETAERVAQYFIENIKQGYRVLADTHFNEHYLEDNCASIYGANQLLNLQELTGNRKYFDTAIKLMISLYHKGVNFDEDYDGLIDGVCYDLKARKQLNCSFIKADLEFLKNRKKIKNLRII